MAEWHVKTTGTPGGAGSDASPWDLDTGLSHSSIDPGDTVWVHGGDYFKNQTNDGFYSSLIGTENNRIRVRNWDNERARIIYNPPGPYVDQGGAPFANIGSNLTIDSPYVDYWGLEFMSTGTRRKSEFADSRGLDRANAIKIAGGGSYVRIINCIIHDTVQGILNGGTWTSNPGLVVYGNLVYYNGWEQYAPPNERGHGHGFYGLSKQSGGDTRIAANIFHTQFSQGIRSGDEGNFNPLIEDNISYVNGEHITPMGGRNIYCGGANNYDFDPSQYVPMTGAILRRNRTYYRDKGFYAPGNPGSNEGVNIGLWWPNAQAQFHDNYIAGKGGGSAVELGYFDLTDITASAGNVIYGQVSAYTQAQITGSFTTTKPVVNVVFVTANEFEPGRAHIAIFNWQNLSSVVVNLASAGLANGQPYEVRDAMNYFGSAVASGTYSPGQQTVTIPMTGLTRAAMLGESSLTPAYVPASHTAPEFGAFIVLPTAQGGGGGGGGGGGSEGGGSGRSQSRRFTRYPRRPRRFDRIRRR